MTQYPGEGASRAPNARPFRETIGVGLRLSVAFISRSSLRRRRRGRRGRQRGALAGHAGRRLGSAGSVRPPSDRAGWRIGLGQRLLAGSQPDFDMHPIAGTAENAAGRHEKTVIGTLAFDIPQVEDVGGGVARRQFELLAQQLRRYEVGGDPATAGINRLSRPLGGPDGFKSMLDEKPSLLVADDIGSESRIGVVRLQAGRGASGRECAHSRPARRARSVPPGRDLC